MLYQRMSYQQLENFMLLKKGKMMFKQLAVDSRLAPWQRSQQQVRLWLPLALLLALVLHFASVHSAYAATFTVNNAGQTADATVGDGICADSSGNCTLRAAIDESNHSSNPDTINFSITQEIQANNTTLTVMHPLTINGPAGRITIRHLNASTSLFVINAGVVAAINNITIADADLYGIRNRGTLTVNNSQVQNSGGGIYNEGSGHLELSNSSILNNNPSFVLFDDFIRKGGGLFNDSNATAIVDNSIFTGNRANLGGGIYNAGVATISNTNLSTNETSGDFSNGENRGGAIHDSGTMTLNDSSVHNNEAKRGGGIYIDTVNSSTISRSTISNNHALNGAGIFIESGPDVNLNNSTVSGNRKMSSLVASEVGYGIEIESVFSSALNVFNELLINHSTITDNEGGGIAKPGLKPVRLFGTIIANQHNGAANCVVTDTEHPFWFSRGYNLTPNCPLAPDPTVSSVVGDQTGTVFVGLAPLADNGGPTETHALLSGSYAADVIPATHTDCAGTDQRGIARPQGVGCDIGAYESTTINVALGKSASQSSTFAPAVASRAVDGNTDGVWGGGSVSRTNTDTNAWWKVDLGASFTIDEIVLWGRTGCCALANYTVYVSDSDISASNPTANGATSYAQTANPNPSLTIPVNRNGRYVMVRLNGTDILSMAEVQVFGTPVTSPVNVAQGKSASQSSIFNGRTADIAVNGITSGNGESFVTHTQIDVNAWWKVDLGAGHAINDITIWNRTDCCIARLTTFTVYVSDSDIDPSNPTANGASSYVQTSPPNPSVTIPVERRGRYVMVRLNGSNFLSLAEVQVIGTPMPNVAQGKSASQSSTYAPAVASRAVDGNTDGVWSGGSVSRTNTDTNAWWKVDLGASFTIDEIVLWGRTGCCALANYTVYVSDSDINPSNPTANGATSYAQTANPNPSLTIPVNRSGRYVMVRLNGTDILSMAEVQVFGMSGGVSGAVLLDAPTLGEENGAVLSDQIFLPLVSN